MSKPNAELLIAIAHELAAQNAAQHLLMRAEMLEIVGLSPSIKDADREKMKEIADKATEALETFKVAQKAVDWYMPNLPADPSERFASLRRFIDEMHKEVVSQAEERLQIPSLTPDWVSPYK